MADLRPIPEWMLGVHHEYLRRVRLRRFGRIRAWWCARRNPLGPETMIDFDRLSPAEQEFAARMLDKLRSG